VALGMELLSLEHVSRMQFFLFWYFFVLGVLDM
jgi:hypothetical protein